MKLHLAHKRTCAYALCGRTFEPTSGKQRCCNRRCAAAAHQGVKCDGCSNAFEPSPRQLSRWMNRGGRPEALGKFCTTCSGNGDAERWRRRHRHVPRPQTPEEIEAKRFAEAARQATLCPRCFIRKDAVSTGVACWLAGECPVRGTELSSESLDKYAFDLAKLVGALARAPEDHVLGSGNRQYRPHH